MIDSKRNIPRKPKNLPKEIFYLLRIELLSLLYIAFILIGAALFQLCERQNSIEKVKIMRQTYEEFVRSIQHCISEEQLRKFMKSMVKSYNFDIDNETLCERSDKFNNTEMFNMWSYDQAILFTSSLVATIGYGNLAPQTIQGKALTIVYALIGIPFTILFFTSIIVKTAIHLQKLASFFKKRHSKKYTVLILITYRIIFNVLIISFAFLIPSAIFKLVEINWTYFDAFYFTVISLTTIGFGDFIPARDAEFNFKPLYTILFTIYLFLGQILLLILLEELSRTKFVKYFTFYIKSPAQDYEDNEDHNTDSGDENIGDYNLIRENKDINGEKKIEHINND